MRHGHINDDHKIDIINCPKILQHLSIISISRLVLNLLTKILGKLFDRCRILDVPLVERIGVIPLLHGLLVVRHATSRLNLIFLLPQWRRKKVC